MVAVELAHFVDGVISGRWRPRAESGEQDDDDEDDRGNAAPSHEAVGHRNLQEDLTPAGATLSLRPLRRYDAD